MLVKKSKNNFIKKFFILVACIAIVIISYLIYLKINSVDQTPTTTTPQRSSSDEIQTSNINKNPESKLTPQNTDTATHTITSGESRSALPMIASVNILDNTVYIRGGINSIVDSNGYCFASLIGPGDQKITKETTILQNPSTTDCKTIAIPVNELSTGTWRLILNYSSDKLIGKSNEIPFEI